MPHDIEGRFKPEIIQRIVIPHKFQCGRKFFIRMPELKDHGKEIKNRQSCRCISGVFSDPAQGFQCPLELSRILIEAFFLFSIKPCSRCSRITGGFHPVDGMEISGKMAILFGAAKHIQDGQCLLKACRHRHKTDFF